MKRARRPYSVENKFPLIWSLPGIGNAQIEPAQKSGNALKSLKKKASEKNETLKERKKRTEKMKRSKKNDLSARAPRKKRAI